MYCTVYIIVCAIFIRLAALRRLHHSAIGIFQLHFFSHEYVPGALHEYVPGDTSRHAGDMNMCLFKA